MNARCSLLLLCAAGLLLAATSFQVGRNVAERREIATRKALTTEPTLHSNGGASLTSATKRDYSQSTITNIGKVDFEQALDFISFAPSEVFPTWMRQLEAMPEGPGRTLAVSAFFKILIQVNAEQAVDLIANLQSRELRFQALAIAQAAAPSSAMPQIARLLERMDAAEGGQWDLVLNWSRTDPVSASKFIDAHPSRPDDSNADRLLIENWSALDPSAAKAWLENLPAERRKSEVLAAFVAGWFERDPHSAEDYVLAKAGTERMGDAIREIAGTLSAGSLDAAGEFLLKFADQTARDAAVDGVVRSSNLFDQPSDARFRAVADWMLKLPQTTWEANIGDYFRKWSDTNPASANAWIAALPPTLHDTVAANFCSTQSWPSPEFGFAVAATIADAKVRARTIRVLCEQIRNREDAAEVLGRLRLTNSQMTEVNEAWAKL